MASVGTPTQCIGSKCRKLVIAEINKPPLCQLCARATQSVQAMARSQENEARTKAQQQRHRYGDEKWQKELRRRQENNLRHKVRAAEAELAASAPSVPRNNGENNRSSNASAGLSSSRYSTASVRPFPSSSVCHTISRAIAPRILARTAPRRLSREKSAGPGNKVSNTGRVRQAGFLIGDDDPLPQNPIQSMMSPPRQPKHHIKYRENRRYDDNDDDDLPENPVHSMQPPPRPKERIRIHKQRENRGDGDTDSPQTSFDRTRDIRTDALKARSYPHGMSDKDTGLAVDGGRRQKKQATKEKEIDDDLIRLCLNNDCRAHVKEVVNRRPIFNSMGGLVDKDEEPEPGDYQEIRRSLRERKKRPIAQVLSKRAPDANGAKLSKAKRRIEEPEIQRRAKRIRFKSDAIAALDQTEDAPPRKKIWAVPKGVKAMLSQAECAAESDPIGRVSVAKSMSLGVPDDDSALLHESGGESESLSEMSQRTLPLNEKMSMWHVDKVTEDASEATARKRDLIRQSTKAAHPNISGRDLTREIGRQMKARLQTRKPVLEEQSETQSKRKLTRFEQGMLKNQPEPKVLKIIVPNYKPSNATDSEPSTSSRSAVARSDDGHIQVDTLTFFRGLPKAVKQGTLKPTTPQKNSRQDTPVRSKNNTPAIGKDKMNSTLHKLFADKTQRKKHKAQEVTAEEPYLSQATMQHNSFDAFLEANQEAINSIGDEPALEIPTKDGYPKHWTFKQRMDAYLDDDTGSLPMPHQSLEKQTDQAQQTEHEVDDEELSDFELDYPDENAEEQDQLFDLLVAMDVEGNIVDNEVLPSNLLAGIDGISANKNALQMISAKALRAIEGLPANSPIDDKIMLDVARKAEQGTLTQLTLAEKQQTQEDEVERETPQQLTIEEFESKKKKYEEERGKLTRMAEAGEDNWHTEDGGEGAWEEL